MNTHFTESYIGNYFELGYKFGALRFLDNQKTIKVIIPSYKSNAAITPTEKIFEIIDYISKINTGNDKKYNYNCLIEIIDKTGKNPDLFTPQLSPCQFCIKKYSDSFLKQINDCGVKLTNVAFMYINAYIIGFYFGFYHFYSLCKKYKQNNEIYFINFDMHMEDTRIGSYKNADVLFYVKNPIDKKIDLHLYELKSFGLKSFIKDVFSIQDNKVELFDINIINSNIINIPRQKYKYSLGFILGNYNLRVFLQKLIELIPKYNSKTHNLLLVDSDFKNLLQVTNYLIDYLTKDIEIRDYLSEISMGVIYALDDGLYYNFKIDEDDRVFLTDETEEMNITLKKIYKEVKPHIDSIEHKTKSIISKNLYDSVEEAIKQTIEDLKEGIRQKRIKMEQLSEITIEPQSTIQEIRQRVRQIMQQFWNSFKEECRSKDKVVKGLALLHSMGAGKTTSARQVILSDISKDIKIFYTYFAPRKKLNEAEFQEVERELKNKYSIYTIKETVNGDKDVRVVFIFDKNYLITPLKKEIKKKQYQRNSYHFMIQNQCHRKHYDNKTERGILSTINDIINKHFNDNVIGIVIFVTTQAVTSYKNDFIGISSDTTKHYANILSKLSAHDFHSVVIFDEISGSDNGFYASSRLFKIIRENTNKSAIFIFDANLHSFNFYKKAFDSFKNRSYISPSLFIVDYQKDGKEDICDIPFEVYSDYSYPAKTVTLKQYFHIINNNKNRNNLYKNIANEIEDKILKGMKEKNERLFIYIQDKNFIEKLSQELRDKGYTVGCYNSSFSYSSFEPEEEIESIDQNVDIIISTSTLSRGISLYNNFTKVCIINSHYHCIENNLAEKLQAIARIRGMKGKDENGQEVDIDHLVDKEIIEIFIVDLVDLIADEEVTSKALEIDSNLQMDNISLPIDLIKELYRNFIEDKILGDVLSYAEITNQIYLSFISPEKQQLSMVVVPMCGQISNIYKPSDVVELVSYYRKLVDMSRVSGCPEEIHKAVFLLKELYNFFGISHGKIFDKVYLPYGLYESVDIDIQLKLNTLQSVINLLDNSHIINFCKKYNSEDMIEHFIYKLRGLSSNSVIKLPGFVYIPLFAIFELIGEQDFSINVIVSKNFSRYSMQVAFSDINSEQIVCYRKNDKTRLVFLPVYDTSCFDWIKGEYPQVRANFLMNFLNTKKIGGSK